MSTLRCCPNGSETVKSYTAGTTIACPRAEEFAHAHHGTHTHYDPATDAFTVVRPLPGTLATGTATSAAPLLFPV